MAHDTYSKSKKSPKGYLAAKVQGRGLGKKSGSEFSAYGQSTGDRGVSKSQTLPSPIKTASGYK